MHGKIMMDENALAELSLSGIRGKMQTYYIGWLSQDCADGKEQTVDNARARGIRDKVHDLLNKKAVSITQRATYIDGVKASEYMIARA